MHNIKTKKAAQIVIIFLLLGAALLLQPLQLFAEPIVKADIDSTEYKTGDIIKVLVRVEDNPGLHGLYFDLTYNSDVLSFQELRQGSLSAGVTDKDKLNYAFSNGQSGVPDSAHIIVSYTLEGENTQTHSTGTLVEVRFRVENQGAGGESYSFNFKDCGIIDSAGEQIIPVIWEASPDFYIISPYSDTFILIKRPYEYEVFYTPNALVSLICTQGDFKVRITNQDYTEDDFDYIEQEVTEGSLLDQSIPLSYEFNTIKASLYDTDDNLLCTDTVKVYRSQDDKFVKIKSPPDHSLVNTDMVSVTVSSPYEQVEVNGVIAHFYGEMDGDNKLYNVRLWLKKGFNTITAVAKSPENVTYKDTIQVYYQKDSSIFNFVLPRAGESFKPSEYSKLLIQGEIGSKYQTGTGPLEAGPVPNTVTLKVIYTPTNRLQNARLLVDNKQAVIEESNYSYDLTRSKYMFYNDFDIPLADLKNGELEIIAYKNKEGAVWEDEIHRIVYIDNNRLWIDLVQPNVFTKDTLDTHIKLQNFNETKELDTNGNITISNEGAIVLDTSNTAVDNEGIDNTSSVIQTPDRTIYVLTNAAGGIMEIYKKKFGDSEWEKVLSRSGMHGYTLCYTDIGILAGVSNLFSTTDSGLYLFTEAGGEGENNLINLSFPKTIQHVQFIENHNGTIYLYGNYYTYLYRFDIFAMEIISHGQGEQDKLEVTELIEISFANNLNINQFLLTSDASTALIRTDADEVYFYNKTESGYIRANLPELEELEQSDNRMVFGKNVICAEYDSGDYNTYLVLKGENNVEVIMKNKNTNRYYRSLKSIDDWLKQGDENIKLLGAVFKNNYFTFLYKNLDDTNNYYVKQGQIFFGGFYQGGDTETKTYTFETDILLENNSLFITSGGWLYIGPGSYLVGELPGDSNSSPSMYCFYSSYEDEGDCNFNYVNDDIDGITGFGFEIDPVWLELDIEAEDAAIEFGFSLKEKAGDETAIDDKIKIKLDRMDLKQLLEQADEGDISDFYKLSHYYDSYIDKQIVHFEFNELEKNKYLHFEISIRPVGNISPAVYNIQVSKKIRAKICLTPGDYITLPIHGYVYDRTVKEVDIQHSKIVLGRDGSFYYDYSVSTEQKLIPVEIYCYNSIGERASVEFTVEIVDSRNLVWDVMYKKEQEHEPAPLVPQAEEFALYVSDDSLFVSGKYYGLEGAIVGYEILGYEYQGGVESLKLLKRGLFDVINDPSVLDDLDPEEKESLGPGYKAGYFTDKEIELVPGKQRLVIYCENPGGLRAEYTVDHEYPDIIYNMPDDEQEIIFYLDDPAEQGLEVEGVPIVNTVTIDAYEQAEPDYEFTREYQISGEIKSLYSFTDLIVKSFTDGLVLIEDDGTETSETTIQVSTGNRFNFTFKAVVDDQISKEFYVGVIPTIPFLTNLRKGVQVIVKKSFEDTNFIPDFSEMHPSQWTEDQEQTLKVPVKLKFNRTDVPVPYYTTVTLTLNYEEVISGLLDVYPEDEESYCIRGENNELLNLTGIKQDKNRIQWVLQYRDPINDNTCTMSSSASGKPNMQDYIFYYYNTSDPVLTEISFSKNLTHEYYDQDTLPELNITKDKSTELEVELNGNILSMEWQETDDVQTIVDYSLLTDVTKQGKNDLFIRYTEKLKTEVTKSYSFLYDSEPPVVKIESSIFSEDFKTLKDLSVFVTEANYSNAFLYNGEDIINRLPEVIIKADDKYCLKWDDLLEYNITPSDTMVKVNVIDLAGRSGFDVVAGLNDIERPDETDIREEHIDLPLYAGTPSLANEANYKAKPFAEHTKYAPDKFLKRKSVKGVIEDKDGYLIRNIKTQKILASDAAAHDEFGASVSISGNYAIVGARRDGDKGNNSGSAYIYERDEDGNWAQKQKLVASDGTAGDSFGSVAISGDYLVVGAYGDDDNGTSSGSAYIYERDEHGNWVEVQKLLASDGAAADSFGYSVSISGNYALVGAYANDDNGNSSGSAYIYERDEHGNWVEVQKLLASDGAASDVFGRSVSISGDYLVVGAHADDNWMGSEVTNLPDTGSAYIYERDSNGNWVEVQKLVPGDRAANDYFGRSVSISGDYIVVGANGDDDNGSASGSAYIYERDSYNWVRREKLLASDGAAGDYFGWSVSISGDYAVVGAYHDDDNGTYSGSAYIFERDSSRNWSQTNKLLTGDGAEYDYFGKSVSIFGDYLVVGAYCDDDNYDNGDNSGSAYIYHKDTDSVTDDLTFPDENRKYLAFKIAKGPSVITGKDSIDGKITFELFGFKHKAITGEIIQVPEENPIALTLTQDKYTYIEGDSYVYYILDIQDLKDRFIEAAGFLFPGGDPGDGFIIFDRGSLRVKYDAPVEPAFVTDIYITGEMGESATEFKDIIVYDPAYEDPAYNPNTDSYINIHPQLKAHCF